MKRISARLAVASLLACAGALHAQWTRTNGPFVGRIRCLAVHGATLFAGTTAGGLFRSADNGTTWSAVGLAANSVQSLAVNGANLFAGTDSGVFVLADAGAGWRPIAKVAARGPVLHLAVRDSHLFVVNTGSGLLRYGGDGALWARIDSGLAGETVNSIVFQGRNMLAGTGSGVFLSTDNGASWTDRSNGLKESRIRALYSAGSKLLAAIDDSLYYSDDSGASWKGGNRGKGSAGFEAFTASGKDLFAGGSAGVFRSMDGGMNWSRMETAFASPWVAAMASSGPHVFAGSDGTAFLRSADGGASWTEMKIGLVHALTWGLFADPAGTLFASTQGDLFRSSDGGAAWIPSDSGMRNMSVDKVAFHPDGQTLFAGTYIRTRSPMSGVFRSRDGGRTWVPSMAGFQDEFHDVRGFAFDSLGRVFAATDGGIYRSPDKGDSWTRGGAGIQTVWIYSIGIDGEGRLFAGTYAGMYRSDDGGAAWIPINDGLADTRIYCLAFNARGHVFAGDYDGGVHRSLDHGKTWTQVLGRGLSMQTGRIALDRAGNLFAAIIGGETGVWISADNGDTWKNALPLDSLDIAPTDMDIAGPMLYISTSNGVWKRPLAEMTAGLAPGSHPSPVGLALEGNFPNPFRHATTVRYRLPRRERVELAIHDLSGRVVRSLVRDRRPAGAHLAVWDGRDGAGRPVEPGIYLLRLQAGAAALSRKMSLSR